LANSEYPIVTDACLARRIAHILGKIETHFGNPKEVFLALRTAWALD